MSQFNKRSSSLNLLTIILVLLTVFVIGRQFDFQDLLKSGLEWVSRLGPWGPIAFAVLYVLAAVFFVPGFILTLGAGVIFGVLKGSLIVIFSATLGATVAFLCGRFLARDWIARKIEDNPKFKAIDEAVGFEGWKIVGLTRLSPVFPFNLLNYAFGVTRVSIRDYVLASFFGMMPGTVMYVYIGSLIGDLATLGTGDRSRSPLEWAFYVAGLVATVAVTVYVTGLARRALDERVIKNHLEARQPVGAGGNSGSQK